jgi:uncharacterized protein (DUF58 family)
MEKMETGAIPTIFTDRLFRYITIILLFIALLNRLQGLTVLGILILSFIYGAKIWSRAGTYNIFLDYKAEGWRLFPGETVSFNITVENQKILPVWLQVVFPENRFFRLTTVKEGSLLWFQKISWEVEATATGRGWYLLSAPTLLIGDPFGFFQEKKRVNSEPVELIVYPAVFPVKMPDLPGRKPMGSNTDRFGLVKDPVFFAGTREYQYGRPARYINWKASARYNNLQEKIFDSSTELKAIFLIDVLNFAEDMVCFEKMLELVASLALQLDQEGFSTGLITNGFLTGRVEKKAGYLAMSRGGDHLSAFLELLARLKGESCYTLEEVLEKEGNIPSGTTVLYFSYSRTEEVSSINVFLKQKRIPVLNIVCNPDQEKTDDFYLLEDFLSGVQ